MSFFIININRKTHIYSKNYCFDHIHSPGNEKLPLLSNPIPYPEYPYLPISAFLVKVTAPNKQFFNVGSLM